MHNQMKTIHHTSYALAVLLLMATALAGCRDSFSDRDLPTPAQTETGAPDGTIEVRLPYVAPLMSTPTTLRTMTPADECAIDAFASRLFVFDSNDKLLYEAPISQITNDPRGKDRHLKGTVTTFLKEGTGLKLALYANLDPAQMKTPVTGKTREEISKIFTFTLSTETPEILPMWGELDGVKVSHTLATTGDDAVQTITGPIKMLRSVARIDVGLNLSGTAFNETSSELKGKVPSATGTTEVTYTLASVEVVNVSLSNTVAPDASVYDGTKNQVTGLYNSSSITHTSKLTYSTISNNVLLRDVYVAETPNPKSTTMKGDDGRMSHEGDAEYAKRPYLIIGLTHSLDKKVRYFRIDFLTSAQKDDVDPEVTADGKLHYDYIDLLRNYRYLVNILKVDGLGYETKEEAAKYSAANIAYNVLVLDESKIGDVMYDGQHTLAVTAEKFSVGKYGSQPTYHVKTTWPAGWVIEVPEKVPGTDTTNSLYAAGKPNNSDWITFATTTGAANADTQVIQTVEENKGAARTGYFYVRAGRMRWLITVDQSDKATLALSLWSDPEATQPLEFVEIHQRGVDVRPTAAQTGTTVEQLMGYRRIYVKTDPYVDPNTSTAFKASFYPAIESAGRDDVFYFWDYGYSSAKVYPTVKTIGESEIIAQSFADAKDKKWYRPSDGGNHRFFTYTVHDNVWECIITAAPMSKSKDPFEFFANTYHFSIADDTDRATADLQVQQIEYGAEPGNGRYPADRYPTTYDGGKVRYKGDIDKPIFAIGKEEMQHFFFITANTPYTITLTRDKGAEKWISGFGNVHPYVYSDDKPDKHGERVLFNTRVLEKVSELPEDQRWVEFRVTSNLGKFEPYTFRIYLVLGIKQPEANCYMIKSGATQGIFIPVSRVNTAADYYDKLLMHDKGLGLPNGHFSLDRLSEDDAFEPFLIWTDMGKPSGTKLADGQYDLTGAGIAELKRVGAGPTGTVYVRLTSDAKPGSALIGIRSSKLPGKPILWSWHLWVVSDYPKALATHQLESKIGWNPKDVGSTMPHWLNTMDRLLGASRAIPMTASNKQDYRDFGYQYQWGRKDPFPTWKEILPQAKWRGASSAGERKSAKEFYDQTGARFYFQYHVKGDRSNEGLSDPLTAAGATITLRESIHDPVTIVQNKSVWMYEHTPITPIDRLSQRYVFRYLWTHSDKTERTYTAEGQTTSTIIPSKSVFDPSPYGWHIMRFREAEHAASQYKVGTILFAPQPSFNYDGDYSALNSEISSDGSIVKTNTEWNFLQAVAEARDGFHSGYYLRNAPGGPGGWGPGSSGSLGESMMRRANTFSVRPCLDVSESDYTKYLPAL